MIQIITRVTDMFLTLHCLIHSKGTHHVCFPVGTCFQQLVNLSS